MSGLGVSQQDGAALHLHFSFQFLPEPSHFSLQLRLFPLQPLHLGCVILHEKRGAGVSGKILLNNHQPWQTHHPDTHFLLLLHILSSPPLELVDPLEQQVDFPLSGGVVVSRPAKQETYFTNTLTGGNDRIKSSHSRHQQIPGGAGL